MLEEKEFFDFVYDEAEDASAHDDSDIKEEVELQYDENFWPKQADEPTGFTYKGKKKIFVKAVENVKILLKKGVQKQMIKLQFKVLDTRKGANGVEMDVEISKDKDRGVAVLKVFGPNSKKECT